jgi:hypothetical protein
MISIAFSIGWVFILHVGKLRNKEKKGASVFVRRRIKKTTLEHLFFPFPSLFPYAFFFLTTILTKSNSNIQVILES